MGGWLEVGWRVGGSLGVEFSKQRKHERERLWSGVGGGGEVRSAVVGGVGGLGWGGWEGDEAAQRRPWWMRWWWRASRTRTLLPFGKVKPFTRGTKLQPPLTFNQPTLYYRNPFNVPPVFVTRCKLA